MTPTTVQPAAPRTGTAAVRGPGVRLPGPGAGGPLPSRHGDGVPGGELPALDRRDELVAGDGELLTGAGRR